MENPKAGKCLKTTDLTRIVFLSGAARQHTNERERQKSGCIMYLMHHIYVPAVEVKRDSLQNYPDLLCNRHHLKAPAELRRGLNKK